MRLPAAPAEGTNDVHIEYRVFISSGGVIEEFTEPGNSGTPRASWLPYIADTPTVEQSLSSLFQGVFTIASSSINLNNATGWFSQYITNDDSYFRRPIDMWYCIGSTQNIRKLFTGRTQTINVSGYSASVDILDSFSLLNRPYYNGDTFNEAVVTETSTRYVTDKQSEYFKVVPFVAGKSTPATLIDQPDIVGDAYLIEPNSMPLAINLGAGNYVACRVSTDGLKTNSIGTIVTITYFTTPTGYGYTLDLSSSNLVLGATVRLQQAARPTRFFHVVSIVSNIVTVWSYENLSNPNYSTPGVTATVFTRAECSALNPATGEVRNLYHGRDFNAGTAITPTSGGNKIVFYDLPLAFAPYGFATGTTRDSLELRYYIRPDDTNQEHGTYLQKILTDNGLSVNAASFTAANADLSGVRLLMAFPEGDAHESALSYCQKITQSTFGGLFFNSAGEIEYKVIEPLVAGGFTVSEDEILGDLAITFETADTITGMTGFNSREVKAFDGEGSSSIDPSDSARGLITVGESIRVQQRHYMDTFGFAVTRIVSTRDRPFKTYRFEVATKAAELDLLDVITLTHPAVPTSSKSVNLLVTGLIFSDTSIQITGCPLEGLPF